MGWVKVGSIKGDTGTPGTAATVAVGTVTTGAAGSTAAVTNTGTSNGAVLAFTVPRGATGNAGTAATVAIGTVTAGTTAQVTNTGTASAATLNFVLPVNSSTVSNTVATAETVATTTYSPLTTAGPTCTITCGAQGILVVTLSAGATINGRMSATITQGATTIFAAADSFSLFSSGGNIQASRTKTFTGLTPGVSYTVTALYNAPVLGNATFAYREVIVSTR